MTAVCARSRRIQFRDARITHNHAPQARMHGAQRQARKVAANGCRNNRCNTPRWVKFEQAKHEAYLPLSSKTRREIKARDTSSKHLKVTRTFNWENQGRQTAITMRHPAKKRLHMSALPSQRSTQHPPSIASPAPPCSGERNASRLPIPTQEDIRENARKNAVSCKTVRARDCQPSRQQQRRTCVQKYA